MRAKLGNTAVHRSIALEGRRFTPQEGLAEGFVDHVVNGNTEAVLAKAEGVADRVSGNARMGVWGMIKVSCELSATRSTLKRTF